jgi:hypothetical protein
VFNSRFTESVAGTAAYAGTWVPVRCSTASSSGNNGRLALESRL